MAFTKINAAGIGTTETVTVDGLTVINNESIGGNLTVTGNATISGVLTYEDVTNVDSVGLITARNGVVVGSGITLSKDGDIFATGVTTSTTFSGNFSGGTVSGTTGTFSSDVKSTAGIVDIRSGSSINTNVTGASASGTLQKNTTSGEFAIVSGGTGGNNYLNFYTSASAAPTAKLRITHEGKIGITESSPANYGIHASQSSESVYYRADSGSVDSIFGSATSLGYSIAGTTSSHPFVLFANNAERARLGSSGEVYFGTSNWPTGSLNKSAGRVMIGNEGSLTLWNETNSAGGGSILKLSCKEGSDATRVGFVNLVGGTENTSDRSSFFKIQVSNSSGSGVERVRIDSTGRLLLNTVTEGNTGADDFTIGQISGSTGITIRSGTTNNGNLYFSDGTSGDDEYRGSIQYQHANNSLHIATNAVERMVITSGGQVNIGGNLTQTDSRAHIQDVTRPLQEGTLTLSYANTTDGAADNGATLRFYGHSGTEERYQASIRGAKENGTSGNYAAYLAFSTRPNGSGMVERMRIDSAGTVRIGENGSFTPDTGADELLVGNANSGVNRGMTIYNSTGSDGRICFAQPGDPDAGMIKYSHGSDLLQFFSEGDELMRLNNTSVQTNDVMELRKPNGASNVQSHMIHFKVGGHDRGAVIAASSFGGSAIVGAISDYRVKTNIRDYTGGWDNIKALPVKIFDISKEGEEATDIKGWIAHEVQSVIPEAVCGNKDAKKEDGSDDLQSLGYNVFMPDVVGALQTAMAKIETLEAEVAALKG